MQSVQRQFGKFMKRSADESQVAIILKDFNEVDHILEKIIEAFKSWRDGWSSLLTHQDRMFTEFETLYAPIIGAAEASSHTPVQTPPDTLARTTRLRAEYDELKKDMLEELAAVDDRIIRPASEAKDCLTPVKKNIKKREDKKLDYERYQNRVDSYTKKTKRSDRDNASLAKAEIDLTKATEEYHAADDNLRQNLPPLITAVFSMLPRLLASQIEIQNNLLGHYYTVIYSYCEEENFSSAPIQMDQAVTQWEQEHLHIQQEVEALTCIANGKAVRASLQPSDGGRNSNSLTGRLTNGRRLSSNQSTAAAPRRGRTPSPAPPSAPTPSYDTKPRLGDHQPSPIAAPSSTYLAPQPSASSSNERPVSPSSSGSLLTPSSALSNAVSRTSDYFSRTPHSAAGTTTTTTTTTTTNGMVSPGSGVRNGHSPGGSNGSVSPGISAMLVGKKKPPPPPPPKPRGSSSNMALYVTALYDFGGQSQGDLAFREGDRIRVLKKTDSTDDWWEGELRGVKGSFPANYVELVQ